MEACTGYRRLVTEKMSEPRESNVQQISDDFSPTNSEDQAKLSSGAPLLFMLFVCACLTVHIQLVAHVRLVALLRIDQAVDCRTANA